MKPTQSMIAVEIQDYGFMDPNEDLDPYLDQMTQEELMEMAFDLRVSIEDDMRRHRRCIRRLEVMGVPDVEAQAEARFQEADREEREWLAANPDWLDRPWI